jgi:serine/threonine protein kinase
VCGDTVPWSPCQDALAGVSAQSQNILLARDGTAKIADVGLARILNRDYVTSLDMAGTVRHVPLPHPVLAVKTFMPCSQLSRLLRQWVPRAYRHRPVVS